MLNLNSLKIRLRIVLARESRKSLCRFFDGHKPTKKRSGLVSEKSVNRFYKKTRYRKILFLNKKDGKTTTARR